MAVSDHEGKALKALLKEAGVSVRIFAGACGVHRSNVQHRFRDQRIGSNAWDKVLRGLEVLQLDPARIRPAFEMPSPDRLMRRWLRDLTDADRESVVRMFASTDTEREALRVELARILGGTPAPPRTPSRGWPIASVRLLRRAPAIPLGFEGLRGLILGTAIRSARQDTHSE